MIVFRHLFLFLTFLGVAFGDPCAAPDTIFNSQSLSTIFDQVLQTLDYQSSFFDFISDPTTDSLKSYLMSNAKVFIPLWCLGGLTLVLFLACAVQICCFNLCKQQSCGTKMSKKSYRPDCIKCLVYLFLFFSLTMVGLGITSFILSSDLLKESDYTICSYNSTFNQLFDGLPAGSSPAWSGVDNFDTYASQIATNFPNVVSTLADIFQSPEYQAIVSTDSNSLYTNAVTSYNCPSSLASQTVSCPFSNLSSCYSGSNAQVPFFSATFCLTNFSNSAASLVLNEQQQNSTLWKQSLVNLSSNILSYNTSLPNFDQLQADAASLQSSITNYKPSLANGIQTAKDNFYSIEIGLYTIFSFIIFIGISGFLGIYCVYCSKVYGCRYILYFLWIFFMLLGFIFFAASGILVIGTFAAFDSCNAYAQLSGNATALPSLSYYGDSTVTDVLFTCFFPSEGSIDSVFNSLSQQTTFEQLSSLQSQYYSSLPSSTFESVTSEIRNQLNYYAVNPNSVTLVNANSTQSPQAALEAANRYASNGGRPSCQAVNDTFVYNPLYCYPLSLNQPAGDPSCILINNGSASIVANRQSSFVTHNCGALFASYQNNFNALNIYGSGVVQLVSLYQSDSGLDTYQTGYFNYYTAVHDFMNTYTQQLFLSFISPFQSLVAGSSCSFLTESLNSLASQTCYKAFPLAYVLSIFVIVLGCIFFLLMILSYYLTVRLLFFEYLKGDLTKYDPNAGSTENIQIQMAIITNREQLIDKSPETSKEVPTSPEGIAQDKNERADSNRSNRYERYARYDREYQDRYARTDPRYNYSRYETINQPRQPSPPRYASPYRR